VANRVSDGLRPLLINERRQQGDGSESRGEQDEPLPRLRDLVAGTLNNAVPNAVIADRVQELAEYVVVGQLWHILHCDKIGFRLIDEAAEFCDKCPFGVRARFPAFAAIGGEWLARRAPGQ
jgi:hypothetical protein